MLPQQPEQGGGNVNGGGGGGGRVGLLTRGRNVISVA